ncbi:HK97 gp10 family phage protein [Micromonospora globbae]|uniref:HK97 gp10 family phage protein n=1 Tax=Micromonospora globbae TaxID=1894969 RepID=UPI001F002611|nr:HK97 gp10 family phage protein [Micromonospora globbae]
MVAEPIRITGLAEFSRNLRKLDNDLPKGLRLAMNEAAQVVVDYARPRIPRRSGRAAQSVRARSTRTAARVMGGGARVPYYPWLDFGGRVGPRRSVERPFKKEGRYIYAGFYAKRAEFEQILVDALVKVARDAGVEVD